MGRPGTKQGGAHPYQSGALSDGFLIVSAHTHGKTIYIRTIIVYFLSYVNKKLVHGNKKRAIFFRILRRRGNGHQSSQTHMIQPLGLKGKGHGFFRSDPSLTGFLADIDFQEDILDKIQPGSLLLDSLEQPQRVYRVDQRLSLIHISLMAPPSGTSTAG